MYRVSKFQFRLRSSSLRQQLQRMQRKNCLVAAAVSMEAMLLVTLRILAGGSYLDIRWPYGIETTTLYSLFEETLFALKNCLPPIHFPQCERECKVNANMFCTLRNSSLCGVIAAFDGIAISIEVQKPHLREASDPCKFYNRKGLFAFCVQAAVQRDYRFCFVSGGTHDVTAFSATKVYQLMKGCTLPEWAAVVVDDAYSNKGRVLSPYNGNWLTQMEETFNAYQSSCPTIVYQALGMLVSIFGVFWSAVRNTLRKVALVILVACLLLNSIIDNADDTLFEYIPSHEENHVHGSPSFHIQDAFYMERNGLRS